MSGKRLAIPYTFLICHLNIKILSIFDKSNTAIRIYFTALFLGIIFFKSLINTTRLWLVCRRGAITFSLFRDDLIIKL